MVPLYLTLGLMVPQTFDDAALAVPPREWPHVVMAGLFDTSGAGVTPSPPPTHSPPRRLEAERDLSGSMERKGDWLPRWLRPDWWKGKNAPSDTPNKEDARRSVLDALRKRRDDPSEWLLISRCRSMLRLDPELARSTIQVTAEGNTVILEGSVASARLKERAERIVRQADGVADVRNALTLTSQGDAWFQQSPITLLAPPGAATSPAPTGTLAEANRGSGPSEEQVLKANLTSEAYGSGSSTARIASPTVWSPVEPAAVFGIPSVTLGPPERIPSREGLPDVYTYVIHRASADSVSGGVTATTVRFGASAGDTITNENVARASLESEPAPIPKPGLLPSLEPEPMPRAPKVIPAPTVELAWMPVASGHEPGSSAPAARASVPTPLASASTPGASAPVPVASTPRVPPATPGTAARLAREVETILRHDPRGAGLAFRLEHGEVTLSGQSRTPSDLYEIAAVLGQIPGVRLVSFENVRFGY